MLALVERNNELSLLLTKRAEHLKHHAGQISFPGGKVENQDRDLIDTAIRETDEEIGVKLTRENILGFLAPLPTISGYLISPVLGFAANDYEAKLDKNEVDLLFELPLSKLTSGNALICQYFQIKKQTYPIYAMLHNNHIIWGATAQILYVLNQQVYSKHLEYSYHRPLSDGLRAIC